ncbi:MAG: MliC family protein [Brumimicrobium sp.]|nr:MliC family protein [Brumimicrobium sp.]
MKKVFLILMLIALAFSCELDENEINEGGDIISIIYTDVKDQQLHLVFDNTKDIVTITFDGDVVELPSQKPASGIWYENEQYELRGKGEHITLYKNKKIVFEN